MPEPTTPELTRSPPGSGTGGTIAGDGWLGRAPCLIDGERIEPAGALTAAVTAVVDPYTGQTVGDVADAGPELVGHAVHAARRAAPAWAATPASERARVLERAAALLLDRGPSLARLVTREMGMPVTLAEATQGELPARVLASFAEATRRFGWVEDADGAELRHVPLGVVAAITPWNMPVYQIVAKVGAALAAGNTVVLKPSELTPFDAVVLVGLFGDAGLPPGALNLVQGGAATGACLVNRPEVAHVSFTGGVAAGKAVASAAGARLASVTLELGGKSPAVLLPDADLAHAVPAVLRSALVNSGQACNATTRLVVPAARAGEIEELLAAALAQVAPGDPRRRDVNFGPLVSGRQRARVRAFIADALACGARPVEHEDIDVPRCGFFVAPRVFTDVPEEAKVLREEVFGPVVVVQTYTDEAEALKVAGDTDYGLSAEVWSADTERAAAFGRALRVGQVKVNGVRTRERPAVPFGGFGLSGFGRELGRAGIAELTAVTAVLR
ncbi:aldehyde dehydrogenase (NAD+)/betaine-aldehyde dehydrogenase [Sinosporangium album]|uniref:aldehyde dehydrogenase (NAD(+)) n=1 Tax=Sinosporangium album TaxID=504805 RepID=A0A1G8B7D0_9ACTN|nr:aldehyde dehydrogenase family protein [Sinosporangium album]SDH29078.1 aldehyde dehydrogenase (NAD+)/betaine-aldehyde dehydrogenase [Sinosporangium album]